MESCSIHQKWSLQADGLLSHEQLFEKPNPAIHSEVPSPGCMAGVFGGHTEPELGIGQRALLLQRQGGGFLLDCVSLIDNSTGDHHFLPLISHLFY